MTPAQQPLRRPRPLLLASVLLLRSVSSASAAGTTAAGFLNLGFGARASGLAEAFVAAADDAAALHYNPAGLAGPPSPLLPQGRQEVQFTHAAHIEDIAFDQAAVLQRPYGLSVTHLRVSGIERRASETVQSLGSFGASDLCVSLGAARPAGPILAGAAVKLIRQSIDDASATAAAADLGVLRRLEAVPLSLGASVANLGTKIRFADQSYPLPRTIRLGAAWGGTRDFPHLLAAQVDLLDDLSPVLRLGGEYDGFGPFSLRAGLRTASSAQRSAVLGKALASTASGLSEFYGLHLGIGLRTRFGNLDYAVVPMGELGRAHRLTFALAFGRPREASTAP